MTKKVYGQHLADAKHLLAVSKEIQADVVACGLGGDDPGKHDPERLRLLEAVAEAARADARIEYGGSDMSFAQHLAENGYWMSDHGRKVLEALAALEVYDDEGTTNQR